MTTNTDSLVSTRSASFGSSAAKATNPDVLLSIAVIAFILTMYLVSAIPGLSRLIHLSTGLMVVGMVVRSVRFPLTLRFDSLAPVTCLFLTFAIASVLWSTNQSGALISAIGLSFDVLGGLLVWAALQNGVRPRALAVTAALGGSIQALTGLVQYVSAGAQRAQGLTGNANSLAIQLSMTAFLLLLLLPRERWTRLLALALIVVATVTTGTRKLIFVWFSYALLILRDLSPMLRRRSLFTGLALVLSPIALWLAMNWAPTILSPLENLSFIQRIEGTLQGRETSTRQELIDHALDLWWQRPVAGYGIDQFRHVSDYTFYSHNNYTELLANLGVIGLMLFYSLYLILLVRSVIGIARGQSTAWVILAILIVTLLMDVARVSYTSRLTWLTIGLMGYYSTRMGEGGSVTMADDGDR